MIAFSKHTKAATVFLVISWSMAPQLAASQATDCSSRNMNFKLYFESDKVAPTSQALAVIDQAMLNAASTPNCKIGGVVATAHTDTYGSTLKNEMLSYTMAISVGDALAARGVTQDMITLHGKGETELAKATNDGVREPLNRRVEVQIQLVGN